MKKKGNICGYWGANHTQYSATLGHLLVLFADWPGQASRLKNLFPFKNSSLLINYSDNEPDLKNQWIWEYLNGIGILDENIARFRFMAGPLVNGCMSSDIVTWKYVEPISQFKDNCSMV